MAHGNSSIAYALFKLAAITGLGRYHDAAVGALKYDQSLFDHEKRIWRKSLDFEGEIHHSWGNGSAGIGLSRHLIGPYYSNNFLEEEINTAIANIDRHLAHVRTADHSICSGFLGMQELRKLLDPDFDYGPLMSDYCEDIKSLNNIKCGGWEKNPLITGLYYGYAGVGYNLLKLTMAGNLPTLLWL